MLNYLYMTEDKARELGFTNEGTLFGVPAWLGDVQNTESINAVAKIPVMVFYFHLMDFFFQLFSDIFNQEVDVPFTVGRSIEDDGSSAAV